MSRRSTACCLWIAGVLVLLTPSLSTAWDNERSGFILGAGVGVGTISGDRVGFSGVAADLVLGYAPGSQWSIQYSGKTTFFAIGDLGYAAFMPMVGVTWYRYAVAPSWFFSGGFGGVGVSSTDRGGEFGAGGFLAAGFEFVSHFSVQLDLVPHGVAGGVELGAALRLNVLGY